MLRKLAFILSFFFLIQVAFAQRTGTGWNPQTEDSIFLHDHAFRYMANIDSILRILNRETDSLKMLSRKTPASHQIRNPSFILNIFNSRIFKGIFWIALGLFLSYILIKLSGLDLLRRKETEDTGSVEIAVPELQQPAWYLQQIRRAEQSGDFIVAIRYQFMNILSAMDENHIIEFLPDKTNALYAREISDIELRSRFLRLASVFEYVWYGKNKIGKAQYDDLKIAFEQTKNYF